MINRVVLVGRLTRDVEVRKTNTGLSVASFTVAVDRRVSRSQENQGQSADFISCVAWRQTADFLGQYAHKGALVDLEGRIQTRSYDRQDGTKAYVTEVVCDSVNLLESKAQSQARAAQSANSYNDSYNDNYGNQNSYNNNYGGYNNNNNSYNSSFNQQSSYQTPAQPAGNDNDFGSAGLDISSDDLPF